MKSFMPQGKRWWREMTKGWNEEKQKIGTFWGIRLKDPTPQIIKSHKSDFQFLFSGIFLQRTDLSTWTFYRLRCTVRARGFVRGLMSAPDRKFGCRAAGLCRTMSISKNCRRERPPPESPKGAISTSLALRNRSTLVHRSGNFHKTRLSFNGLCYHSQGGARYSGSIMR